jgi:tetratricopeptide (TPR) repeat protein
MKNKYLSSIISFAKVTLLFGVLAFSNSIAQEVKPSKIEELIEKVNTLEQRGKYQESLNVCNKIITIVDKNTSTFWVIKWHLIKLYSEKLNQFENAFKTCQEIKDNYSIITSKHEIKDKFETQMGIPIEFIIESTDAISGYCLERMNKPEEAKVYYDKSLKSLNSWQFKAQQMSLEEKQKYHNLEKSIRSSTTSITKHKDSLK